MITYAQIEAIHEAMRELAMHRKANVYVGDGLLPLRHYHADAVENCLAKIRAALAGEVRMERQRTPTGGTIIHGYLGNLERHLEVASNDEHVIEQGEALVMRSLNAALAGEKVSDDGSP